MSKISKQLIFCILSILPCSLFAQMDAIDSLQSMQNLTGGCGFDALLQKARQNISFRAKEEFMNRQILSEPVTLDAAFTLPVVFHIISPNPSSITDQDILDALKDLNDAFGRKGQYAASNGVDTKINFCLAQTDPDGGITNGINRIKSPFGKDLNQVTEDERLKSLVQWDPLHYINIWYVENIHYENFVYWTCQETNGSQWNRIGTEGYATMPGDGGKLDGIVVSKFEAILAHEMGHYLGLYHTFEGGCNNTDCATSGDRVCDTPPDNTYLPSSCTNPTNSCRTDTLSNYSNGFFLEDVPDQVTNFMDYGNWGCANEFTNGQAQRMKAMIMTERKGLLEGRCNKPCNQNIAALFERDIALPTPGQIISFSNHSTGASNFQWLVDNVVVGNSTDLNYKFDQDGIYKVTLKAFNNPGCFATYTDYVDVSCGVLARFYTDKQLIASKTGFFTESVTFTNTSENANQFKWLVSNDAGMSEQMVSTENSLTYTFPDPANYNIRLIASDGTCNDTTLKYNVRVLDPTPDARPRISRVECYEETKIQVTFNVCNSGYTPLPAGLPVSFFDADPTKPGAKKIGTTFTLPDSIRGGCCSPMFTTILEVGRRGLNEVYVVLNETGTTLPIKLGLNLPIERSYDNNIASFDDFSYHVEIQPDNPVLEPGDTIQLTANVTPVYSTSTFKWTPTGNINCNDCDSLMLIADSTREYTVIANNGIGCSDTTTITVNVPPAYDYTIKLDTAICGGGNNNVAVRFTISNNFKRGFIPKGLAVSFYDRDPASSSAKLIEPSFTVPESFTGKQKTFETILTGVESEQIFAVVNDNGSGTPLELPNTLFEETDYSNNTSSIRYSFISVKASNDGPICESDTVTLTAIATKPDASYNWTGPDGFKSTKQKLILSHVSGEKAGEYMVTASKNGCTSDTASTSIVIAEQIKVVATVNTPICVDGSINLKASSERPAKFLWKGPGGFTSNEQNPIIKDARPDHAGTYSVVAVNSNNCPSSQAVVTVSVNPSPDPKFSATDICAPETSVNFTNKSTISSGNIVEYRWNFGDLASDSLNTSGNRNPAHAFSSPGRYNVSLTAISDSGCTAKITQLFDGIHKQPIAAFASDMGGICANQSATFLDKSVAQEGAITKWIWTPGDASPAVSRSTPTPFTHTFVNPGNVSVKLQVENSFGCAHDTLIELTVMKLPEVNAGPDLRVLEGGSTQLRGSGSGNSIRFAWTPQVYLSSASVPDPQVNRPPDSITYILTVTDKFGCTAMDDVTVRILRKLNVPNAFSPNGDGVNDVWNIRYLVDYPENVVEIFDRYGALVFKSIGYNKPWDGTRNGTPVPIGVYYYIITPKNGAERINGSVTLIR